MWTTIVYSLSQVADHPMSSPCWVDKAGPVLAYRAMHLNDVVSASSPMIPLDIKYSTHLVWVDDPASRVLLARAPQQWGKQAAQWIYVGFPVFTSGTTGQYLDNKGVDPNTWPELSRRFDRVQSRYVPPVSRKLLAFFPLPFFWFLGIRRSAWKKKNGNCNYSSKLHELKLLVFLCSKLYQNSGVTYVENYLGTAM